MEHFTADQIASACADASLTDAQCESLLIALHYTAPHAAAKVAPPSFSTDPDGDLSLDWVVGDASLSVSFSKTGVVSWATNVAGKSDSGSQQVAQDSGRIPTKATSDMLKAAKSEWYKEVYGDRPPTSHTWQGYSAMFWVKIYDAMIAAAPAVQPDSGRDAAVLKERIKEILIGIDQDQSLTEHGWWPTSCAVKWGSEKLAAVLAAIDAAMENKKDSA